MMQAVGRITVAVGGVPIRATSGQVDPALRFACHGVLIQAVPTNTGRIYIGSSVNMHRTTLLDVYAVLAIPTANQIPTFSAALTLAPAAIQLQSIWLDAEVSGDGVLISVLIT